MARDAIGHSLQLRQTVLVPCAVLGVERDHILLAPLLRAAPDATNGRRLIVIDGEQVVAVQAVGADEAPRDVLARAVRRFAGGGGLAAALAGADEFGPEPEEPPC